MNPSLNSKERGTIYHNMLYTIQHLTDNNLSQAKSYVKSIFHLKNESLVARFLIARHIEQQVDRTLTQEEKKLLEFYQTGNCWFVIDKRRFFFSISHKNNLVCIWVDNQKIAVDIEEYKIRDESLLSNFSQKEYDLLGSNDQWLSFYKIWTAKEALIKYLELGLDSMGDIQVRNVQGIKQIYSCEEFDLQITLEYDNNNFLIYSWSKNNHIYALILNTSHEQI